MHVISKKGFVLFSAIALTFIFTGIPVLKVSAQGPGYMSSRIGECPENAGVERGTKAHPQADPDGGWQSKGAVLDWWGPMPQTNYTPHYGCYPGNARTIHRYPAFHGYYYRNPYNYRMYSEFPWHADMAEPEPYPEQTLKQIGSQANTGEPYDGQEIIIKEMIINTPPVVPATPAKKVPTPAKTTKYSVIK